MIRKPVVILFLLIVGFLFINDEVITSQPESADVQIGTQVGMKAPDFLLPLVGSDPLEKVSLYDYVGQYDVVMLYVFSAAN